MDWLVIDGFTPYDGRYEFDLIAAEPTTREWGWIKRLSGYMPLTIENGLDGGDPELFSAFAVIALRRAGKLEAADVQRVFERLVDAPFSTTIRLESDPVEESQDDDAGPPEPSSSRNGASSGGDSTTSSETSTETPDNSGTPDSDTSVLAPVTWGS